MLKLLTLKKAKEILGVCTKTIQRWDKEGKIKCVRTPGNRRRVPESEILRILGETKLLPAPKTKIEQAKVPKTTIPAPEVKKTKKAPHPAELQRHELLDSLAPTGLAQRTVFGNLLSAAAVLKTFTLEELASRAHCPEAVANTFCERMRGSDYLAKKDGVFELRVRLLR